MASAPSNTPLVALEGRLRHCRNVRTLGVRPNFLDYSPEERRWIGEAAKIYYPSPFYAELLDTMGKPTFPSYHTYKFAQDKIKQTALFQMAGIPHPRTRVFYGRRQKAHILDHFSFPFIAKVARGSALGKGVYLIRDAAALAAYCQMEGPAYIQQYLPMEKDIRAVVIGGRVVHAYWRVAPVGDHRTNIGCGGDVDFSPVPEGALALAAHTARVCRWDDVGLDIACRSDAFVVLEANMKYGREGFRRAGIDYNRLLEQCIADGCI